MTLMFNYHDLGHLGVDRAAMNQAVFRALKSGGLYVIADHSGRPGTGISESGTLHRIEEAFLRQEVEAAGFKLLGRATSCATPTIRGQEHAGPAAAEGRIRAQVRQALSGGLRGPIADVTYRAEGRDGSRVADEEQIA